METEKNEQLWLIAKKRVKFKRHLATYIVINTFLWILWYFTDNKNNEVGVPWPLFSMLGWGIGLMFSFLGAYVFIKHDAIEKELGRLRATSVNPKSLPSELATSLLGQAIERDYTLADLLRRPNQSHRQIDQVSQAVKAAPMQVLSTAALQAQVVEQVEIQSKYAGYIVRQQAEIERQETNENFLLPEDLDYQDVRGLSKEAQQKLNKHRPQTLGQASRISGITPAAASLLLVYLKKRRGMATLNSVSNSTQDEQAA